MTKPTEHHWDAGRRGESIALNYLLERHYQLVEKNYRFGRGEIDLIMESPEKILVFVEVKSNRKNLFGSPLERIDGRKIRQLQKIAQRYCWQKNQLDREMRFDVIGIELEENGENRIDHVKAAFIPEGSGYY